MNYIIKVLVLVLIFQSFSFAGGCDAPGSPSKYIPTKSQIIENTYSNKQQYWYCVSNSYKNEFRVAAQTKNDFKNKKKKFKFKVRLYDKKMNEIDGSGSRSYAGKITVRKRYKKLKQGQYYLLVEALTTKGRDDMAIYVDGY